jgi:hypothetical protein
MAQSSEHTEEDLIPIQNFMRRFSHADPRDQEPSRQSPVDTAAAEAAKQPTRNDPNFVMSLNVPLLFHHVIRQVPELVTCCPILLCSRFFMACSSYMHLHGATSPVHYRLSLFLHFIFHLAFHMPLLACCSPFRISHIGEVSFSNSDFLCTKS